MVERVIACQCRPQGWVLLPVRPLVLRYAEGTTVALTAVPENGWEFVGWSGDGISGSENPISIVMNADKAVTARFTRATIDGNMVINSDFSSGRKTGLLIPGAEVRPEV